MRQHTTSNELSSIEPPPLGSNLIRVSTNDGRNVGLQDYASHDEIVGLTSTGRIHASNRKYRMFHSTQSMTLLVMPHRLFSPKPQQQTCTCKIVTMLVKICDEVGKMPHGLVSTILVIANLLKYWYENSDITDGYKWKLTTPTIERKSLPTGISVWDTDHKEWLTVRKNYNDRTLAEMECPQGNYQQW